MKLGLLLATLLFLVSILLFSLSLLQIPSTIIKEYKVSVLNNTEIIIPTKKPVILKYCFSKNNDIIKKLHVSFVSKYYIDFYITKTPFMAGEILHVTKRAFNKTITLHTIGSGVRKVCFIFKLPWFFNAMYPNVTTPWINLHINVTATLYKIEYNPQKLRNIAMYLSLASIFILLISEKILNTNNKKK